MHAFGARRKPRIAAPSRESWRLVAAGLAVGIALSVIAQGHAPLIVAGGLAAGLVWPVLSDHWRRWRRRPRASWSPTATVRVVIVASLVTETALLIEGEPDVYSIGAGVVAALAAGVCLASAVFLRIEAGFVHPPLGVAWRVSVAAALTCVADLRVGLHRLGPVGCVALILALGLSSAALCGLRRTGASAAPASVALGCATLAAALAATVRGGAPEREPAIAAFVLAGAVALATAVMVLDEGWHLRLAVCGLGAVAGGIFAAPLVGAAEWLSALVDCLQLVAAVPALIAVERALAGERWRDVCSAAIAPLAVYGLVCLAG